jgi:RNA polymerase sigma-70 factor (ECF subfamily)
MINESDLPDVVAAAGRGEQQALAVLYRAYQPALIRYLRAQAPDVADDLASEVWIAVSRGLASFTGDEAGLRAWLFTIARRRVIDHRRRTARRRTDATENARLEVIVDTHGDGDPATALAEGESTQDVLDVLVAELSPEQAEAVLLRVVAGLPVADVARIMERPPGTVRVLCHRALHRLAVRLGDGARIR